MTPGAWGRLLEAIRRRDFRRAVIFASRKLRLLQLDRVLIMECDLLADRQLLGKLREREPAMIVRAADETDLPMLERLFPHHAGKYAGRFQGGELCLLVEQEGAPLAMGWVTVDARAGIDELGCRLDLPSGTCWGYDTFVLPEHRRRGAFVVLMWEMFELLKARGVRAMYASIAYENDASRAAHGRLGYTTALVIDRFKLAGLSFYRMEPRAGRTAWLRDTGGGRPAYRLT